MSRGQRESPISAGRHFYIMGTVERRWEVGGGGVGGALRAKRPPAGATRVVEAPEVTS